jgi:hypothetical protein
MTVICINSSNKPAKVPIEQWVKEGETYTIIKLVTMGLQDGKHGVLLKEVQMSADCFPYEYYDADRFVPLDTRVANMEEEAVKEADLELI